MTDQHEVEELKKITKKDVLDMYMERIHYSSPVRSKLSTHMKSQYKGIKFDLESARPLMEQFAKHSIIVDPASLGKLLSSQPDLQTVKDFANNLVKSAELSPEAREELSGVVDSLKGKEGGGGDDADVRLSEGNVFIEDIHAFKAGLIPSKAARPVQPLGSLAKL